MYRKLLPHVNRFVMLRQSPMGQCYVGRLLSVDSDAVEIETFHPDGTRAACWVINVNTITEFLCDSRQLDTLALRVKWANSPEKPAVSPADATDASVSPANLSGGSAQ